MRHRYNKLKSLSTWMVKKENVVRNLLTSLITSGHIVTTTKRAQVLKSEIDRLFSQLLSIVARFEDKADARRESIRVVKSVLYTELSGKKVIDELLPKYIEEGRKSWFVQDYKLWFRPWDAAEKIMVKLI